MVNSIRFFLKILIVLFFLGGCLVFSRKLYYLEEIYQLYSIPQLPDNEDYLRNIHWMRVALSLPFAPPLYALRPPRNEEEYLRYQKLMVMHIRYLIIKNTLFLAARFDRHQLKFYHQSFKKDILRSLDIAEYLYRKANKDWGILKQRFDELVKEEKNKVIKDGRRGKIRTPIEFLERMIYKLTTGELDYERVISRQLKKIEKTRNSLKQ